MKKHFFTVFALLAVCAMLQTACVATLAVLDFNAPSTVSAGQSFQVSVRVRNVGMQLDDYQQIHIWLSTDRHWSTDDIALKEVDLPVLDASDFTDLNESVTIPSGTLTGTYFLLVKFYWPDPQYGGYQSELSYRLITVNGLAPNGRDLVAQNIFIPQTVPSLITPQAYAGENLTVHFELANRGNVQAGPSMIEFFASSNLDFSATDDFSLGTMQVGTLPGNAKLELTAALQIPGNLIGSYNILIKADANDNVVELNENNNLAARYHTAVNILKRRPDLRLLQQYVPALAVAGSSIPSSVRVQNIGSAESAPCAMQYWLSVDPNLGAGDQLLLPQNVTVGGLALNAQTTLENDLPLPSTLASGTYYVIFFADGAHQLTESNEQNNLASMRLYVLNVNNFNNLDDMAYKLAIAASRETAHPEQNDPPVTVEKSNGAWAESLKFYPNPARDWVNAELTLEKAANARFSVFDASGRHLHDFNFPMLEPGLIQQQFDLGGVPEGTYLVRAEVGGETVTKTIVVQR